MLTNNKWARLILCLLLNSMVLVSCSVTQLNSERSTIEIATPKTDTSRSELQATKELDLSESLFINDDNVQQIPLPRSDFDISLPQNWSYEVLQHTKPYGVEIIGPSGDSDISFSVIGRRFHENQDSQIIIDNFLRQGSSTKHETYKIDDISYLVAQFEPDEHGFIKQFAFLETETQFVLIDGNNPARKNDKVKFAFDYMVNALEINNEQPRKATAAERQQLGKSGFSVQQLKEYKIFPLTENIFRMEYDWPGDNYAPKLDIWTEQFENEQLANEWLKADEQLDIYESITPLKLPGIKGFIADRVIRGDYGPLKSAVMIASNEAFAITLVSTQNIPNENEDVFRTVIESIEWESKN